MMANTTSTTFMVLLGLSQAVAIGMVILVIIWTKDILDGYAWDGSLHEFNLHPLCMVCGFILLYGEASLAFRVFTKYEKRPVKVIHGSFHILAFIAAVIGLVAVFDFHNTMHIKNLYTLHSWCGLSTIVLFGIQFLLGFVSFFFPRLSQPIRECYLPIHRYFGLAILFLAAISTVSGINEKLFFKFSGKDGIKKYDELPHGAVIGNCLGMMVVAYIVFVGFLVHNPSWQRESDQDTGTDSDRARFQPITTHGETTDEE